MSLLARIFSERRAVMAPLAVLLILNIAVLALIVWPLQRRVDGSQEARYQAVSGLDAARRMEAQAKAERTSKERANVELKKFYTEILPRDFRSAVGVASFWLGRVAEDARLTFRAGQWDREQARNSRRDSALTKVTGQVTLTGDYANIRRFLYEVETAQEFVIIEKVELSQANSTQVDSPLEVALSVATYFVSDPEPAGVKR
jgi:Tfp pilus assembly protein PilV